MYQIVIYKNNYVNCNGRMTIDIGVNYGNEEYSLYECKSSIIALDDEKSINYLLKLTDTIKEKDVLVACIVAENINTIMDYVEENISHRKEGFIEFKDKKNLYNNKKKIVLYDLEGIINELEANVLSENDVAVGVNE